MQQGDALDQDGGRSQCSNQGDRAPSSDRTSGAKAPSSDRCSTLLARGRQSSRKRWTVIEEFEYDGFSYRVSRRPVEDSVRRLTTREEEVLGYAERGYNNKLIASALGVAPSTVGVLLYRAAGKVGAKSRRELLRAYATLKKNQQHE